MLKLFSTGELANRWSKCRETILYYVKIGKLKPSAFVNGKAVFTEEEVFKFEDENQKPLPKTKAA